MQLWSGSYEMCVIWNYDHQDPCTIKDANKLHLLQPCICILRLIAPWTFVGYRRIAVASSMGWGKSTSYSASSLSWSKVNICRNYKKWNTHVSKSTGSLYNQREISLSLFRNGNRGKWHHEDREENMLSHLPINCCMRIVSFITCRNSSLVILQMHLNVGNLVILCRLSKSCKSSHSLGNMTMMTSLHPSCLISTGSRLINE